MADFGHLQSKHRDTAEFTFFDIVGEPKLIVKTTGETNKPYFNEKLRRAEQFQRRKAKISVELVKAHRDRDRELFPKFVVVGWSNVKDKDGKDVPFSKEDCEAFLRAIDDEAFDALRVFCDEASNFREVMDGAPTAGN